MFPSSFILRRLPAIFLLGALVMAEAARGAEEFKVEAISDSLLRLQARTGKDGKVAWFVNNFDQELFAPLLRKPEQAVRVGNTGESYASFQFTPEAEKKGAELILSLSVVQAKYPGLFVFGLTNGDGSGNRRSVPSVAVKMDAAGGIALAAGGIGSKQWTVMPDSAMQPGRTYRLGLKTDLDKGTWTLRLMDETGKTLASKETDFGRNLNRTYNAVFFQNYSKNPVLIEGLAEAGPAGSAVLADFQKTEYHAGEDLIGQHTWTGTAGGEVRVLDTRTVLADYIPAKLTTRLYLSRDRYAAEDGGFTAVCVLPVDRSVAAGYVFDWKLLTAAGAVILSRENLPVAGNQFSIYQAFPPALAGNTTTLQVTVRKKATGEGEVLRESFFVAPPKGVATRGGVAIHVPGKAAVAGAVIPYAVGVPFPKGALMASSKLRLVDETGAAVDASFEIDGKWDRSGSVRWVKCFFALPVSEKDVVLQLNYGGENGVAASEPVPAGGAWDGRFAGRYLELKADVIGARATPEAAMRSVLKTSSLTGAYVIDGNATRFVMTPAAKSTVERSDAQQLMLRQKGWYAAADGAKHCQFDNRLTFFKGAPFIRVEHMWMFTGDGNKDSISEMGWRFASAAPIQSSEFWQSGDLWQAGQQLLQSGADEALLVSGEKHQRLEQRSLGIGRVKSGNGGLGFTVAVKDFWQNFPAELTSDEGSYSVLTWPRHGKSDERPVSVENSYKLPFIHSGEKLSFRLPQPYVEKPIYDGAETHYDEGKIESANAQGIAKTTEMWVYAGESTTVSAAVLAGLCDRSLSAYADPAWIAASQVFHEIHEKDVAQFPKEEAVYESVALAPARWAERMGVYGKWIWGDVLSMPDLTAQVLHGNFRAFRKGHQGWPYSWLAYARSGDARLRNFAEANTRHMADVNFCHYSDERAPRELGFWNRSLIPWTFVYGPTSRHYVDKVDYLWAAWHLADDYRAKETALAWEAATKTAAMDILPWSGNRRSVNMLKTYVDSYEETLSPWFIPAYREIAALHKQQDKDSARDDWSVGGAALWNAGPREYLRFTGDESYRRIYLNYANHWGAPDCDNIWIQFGVMPLESLAYAYTLTGDAYYARRLRGYVDWAKHNVYDGPEEWMQGFYPVGVNRLEQAPMFAGYFLSQFPFAQAALVKAGNVAPIPNGIAVMPGFNRVQANGQQELPYARVYVLKQGAEEISLKLNLAALPPREAPRPWVYGVVSPDGTSLTKGEWKLEETKEKQPDKTLTIPAQAAKGTYATEVRHVFDNLRRYPWGAGPALMMPLSQQGVPEVFAWPRGADLPLIALQSQLWFRWPEGGEPTLTLKFRFARASNEVQMPTVLDGAGKVLWAERLVTEKATGERVLECQLNRDAVGTDGMVQVIFPGRDILWQVAGAGDLYFALSKDRWFQPQIATAAAVPTAAVTVTKKEK